jgi:endonuclease-3
MKAAGGRSPAATRRMGSILKALQASLGPAKVELAHRSPLELLVATILSAQCTDERVNRVTPALFRSYLSAGDYAAAAPAELEAAIRSTGFFKSKARNLIACGRALVDRHGGGVPDTIEELTALPGVGRKTANVILGNAFGKPGLVVDTHVKRVARRLGLSASEDPGRIEQDLQRLIPRAQWTSGSQRLLLHGRYVCVARAPKCERCALYSECAWEGKRPR